MVQSQSDCVSSWLVWILELIVIMFNFSVLQLLAVNETILHGIGQFKIISNFSKSRDTHFNNI